MAKIAPFHTDSKEYSAVYRDVYHDSPKCKDGAKIAPQHRQSGTGKKPRCKMCAQLDA